MVIFDSTFLLLTLQPRVPVPPDPKTKKPIDKGFERVEHLIDTLSDAHTRIFVPSPVLAEVLVYAGDATAEYIAKLRGVSGINVVDFDTRAAIECARLTGAAIARGKKRGRAPDDQPWQKVKIDRQIIAVAKVHQAEVIYTCDVGLAALAQAEKFTVWHIADLPMPPFKDQPDLPFPKRTD